DLYLKKGIPVLLLENLAVTEGWVNGTRCIVESIDEIDVVLLRRVADGQMKLIEYTTSNVYRTHYSRSQLPIAVAFAATIHKVQSLTLEHGVVISLAHPFLSHGEFYVACSRV
ncbi:uncharacterized protein RHIMIDRAFT_193290, partial [Rhizopus microsporus ATCC 52813]